MTNDGILLYNKILFHINGTPREKYIPTTYVEQTTIETDQILEIEFEVINK